MKSRPKLARPACIAKAIILLGVLSACESGGVSPGTVAAVATAPVMMPVMVFEARRNDREAFLERAKRNRRPLPPLDAESRRMADTALRQALVRGETGEGHYWENDRDGNGRRAGGSTVLSEARTATGALCRDVLAETVAEGLPTDQRVRTWCRHGAGPWEEVLARP